jgi:hypothetical protein
MKTGLKNKTQPVLVKPSTSKQTNGTQSSCGCKFATSNRKSFPVEMDVSSATQDPYFASFRACVDRMMILYGWCFPTTSHPLLQFLSVVYSLWRSSDVYLYVNIYHLIGLSQAARLLLVRLICLFVVTSAVTCPKQSTYELIWWLIIGRPSWLPWQKSDVLSACIIEHLTTHKSKCWKCLPLDPVNYWRTSMKESSLSFFFCWNAMEESKDSSSRANQTKQGAKYVPRMVLRNIKRSNFNHWRYTLFDLNEDRTTTSFAYCRCIPVHSCGLTNRPAWSCNSI